MPTVPPVRYVLELPDGQLIRCRDAYQARRLAEVYIVLTIGHTPNVAPK